jgi:hypothetical protein
VGKSLNRVRRPRRRAYPWVRAIVPVISAYADRLRDRALAAQSCSRTYPAPIVEVLGRVAEASQQPSFLCPRCGMRSYNPNDIRWGYCGACHDYTGDPTEPQGSYQP